MTDTTSDRQSESTKRIWKIVYLIGGWAALLAPIIFRRNLGTEFVAFNGFGIFDVPAVTPVNASGWFELLHSNQFVGLTLMNVFDMVNYVLVGLMFVALYGALRFSHKRWVGLAVVLVWLGVVLFVVSNQAFPMLALSKQYAVTTITGEQSALLAAGEALLAIDNPGKIYQGTGAILALFLVTVAGLIISIVMLRSTVFSRVTGWMGLLANSLLLGYFAALVFAPMVYPKPPLALYAIPPSVSALFRVTWYVMAGIRLLRLRRA